MKKFEYRVEELTGLDYKSCDNLDLNLMGECGWELVSVCSDELGIRTFFKREINQPSPTRG